MKTGVNPSPRKRPECCRWQPCPVPPCERAAGKDRKSHHRFNARRNRAVLRQIDWIPDLKFLLK